MPYKDHEQKLAAMREWRKKKIAEGYGKWLYERRKLRFEDTDRFKRAIEGALDKLQHGSRPQPQRINDAVEILSTALRESLEAEEALGEFKGKEKS